MLTCLSRNEVAETLAKRSLLDTRIYSAFQLGKLHAELGRTRERGYGFDDEGVAAGLRCIAIAIRDGHGAALAAISVAGPTSRLIDDRMSPLVDLLRATGEAVTWTFGEDGGPPKDVRQKGARRHAPRPK